MVIGPVEHGTKRYFAGEGSAAILPNRPTKESPLSKPKT
jgi:hypothetical protein